VVFPHEACPVDGVVVDGHSTMNESARPAAVPPAQSARSDGSPAPSTATAPSRFAPRNRG
jgi:hypothetical protein